MDFEVFSGKPKPPSFLSTLERLIGHRREAWTRWASNPPHRLGWAVFFSVVLELVLATRLLNGDGLSRSFWRQAAITGGCFLLFELLLSIVAAQVAELFETEGQASALMTFLNMGLTPLLLVLPASLLIDITGRSHQARLIVLILLMTKVLLNWREAIERTYKLKKMQSALVFYATAGISLVLLLITAYLVLFNRIATLFQ